MDTTQVKPKISPDSYGMEFVASEERFPIIDKAVELIHKGAKNALLIGLDEHNRLIIDATLGSYEELISVLTRATLDVTVAHNKYINDEAAKVSE